MLTRKASLLVLISAFQAGLALGSEAIPNWTVPAFWTPPRSHGVTTFSEAPPVPFIAVTPCRVADTRGNEFTGSYGPPALVANATRTFVIAGQCGIPSGAAAVSFNFAALNVGALGDLRVFPAGGGVPLVSTMNYNANTPNIANAAIVPLGTGGAITLQADATTIDIIIDINGYFSGTPADPTHQFAINNNSTLPTVLAINSSTACSLACGILGETGSTSGGTAMEGVATATGAAGTTTGVRGLSNSTTNGATGVFGSASGTTGAIFGVVGTSLSPSNDAAGVLGYDTARTAGGASFARAGVRGESENGNGVEGLSNAGMAVSGYLLSTSGTILASGILGNGTGPQGVSYTGGLGGSGTKSFLEPHPTDPTKMIRYVSLEGPEAGTYFRGTTKTVGGVATIQVPEDFRIVTDEDGLTVQVTPTGSKFTMVTVESADLNTIIVRASRDVTFHYLVQGVRRAYKDIEVVTRNFLFVPRSANERMPEAYSPVERQRLIANGTYNADGTVNRETAERVGWASAWREQEEQAKAAAAANTATHATKSSERK